MQEYHYFVCVRREEFLLCLLISNHIFVTVYNSTSRLEYNRYYHTFMDAGAEVTTTSLFHVTHARDHAMWGDFLCVSLQSFVGVWLCSCIWFPWKHDAVTEGALLLIILQRERESLKNPHILLINPDPWPVTCADPDVLLWRSRGHGVTDLSPHAWLPLESEIFGERLDLCKRTQEHL